MGGVFEAFDISGSALRAERLRMNLIANNLANVTTTRTDGRRLAPFRRQQAIFSLGAPDMTGDDRLGVRLDRVEPDPSPLHRVYNPGHPDAVTDEDIAQSGGRFGPGDRGYVLMPNVDFPIEMVDMIEASRAYEASVTAIQVTKAMLEGVLQVLA